MGSKPKTPKPTAQELELQRGQREELDDLTRSRNESLKAIKRSLGGRRTLLGSGSELGIRPVAAGGRGGAGGQGLGIRGGGGGIMSSGGGSRARGGGGGGFRAPPAPRGGAARQ